jgi:hypothetical protein
MYRLTDALNVADTITSTLNARVKRPALYAPENINCRNAQIRGLNINASTV